MLKSAHYPASVGSDSDWRNDRVGTRDDCTEKVSSVHGWKSQAMWRELIDVVVD